MEKHMAITLRSLVPFGGNGNGTRSQPPAILFGSLQREIDRLFDDFTRGGLAPAQVNLVPSMDVTETDNEIVVTAELPGLERGDVEISIEDDVLTIRGEKKVEQDKDDKNYHVSERVYGTFYRVLQLPPGVDASKVQATMSNGVLKIAIPKPAKTQPQKIEVKDESDGQSQSAQSGQPAKKSKEAA
jgi:HSP20 family protein